MKLLWLSVLALSISGCGNFEGKPKTHDRVPSADFKAVDATGQFAQDMRGIWIQECQPEAKAADHSLVGADFTSLKVSSSQVIWRFSDSLVGEQQINFFTENSTCEGAPSGTNTSPLKYELLESRTSADKDGTTINFVMKLTVDFTSDDAGGGFQSAQVYDLLFTKNAFTSNWKSTTKASGENVTTAKAELTELSTTFKRDRANVARSKRPASPAKK